MILLEIAALLLGFGAMVGSSKSAVDAATALAAGSRVPPFVIGLTLLAVGTDLPEIANSIVSSGTGHGDVNVGDSVGSAGTQMTLVIGLLPLTTGMIKVPKRNIALTGGLTAGGLVLLMFLMRDSRIDRSDSAVMLSLWLVGSFLIYRRATHHQQLPLPMGRTRKAPLLARLLASFVVLAGGAMLALWSIIRLAERFDAPEFLVGFFVAALGTSLPELVFAVTAVRKGAVAMAFGDVMGSSFVDVTGSVAIGPAIFPIDVSRDLVLEGTIAAAIAITAVTIVLARITDHDWRTGTLFLAIYAAFFAVLI